VGMFLLPVFMQELLGFTALQSGLVLLPRAMIMMVSTPIVGFLYNRVQPRVLIAFGVVCVAAGSWEMGRFTLDTGTRNIIPILLLQGVGFSCLFVPLATVALSYIPRFKMADAAGLNSLFRQFGGSAGLAIYGTLLDRIVAGARAALVVHVDLGRLEVMQRLAGATAALVRRGMDPLSARATAFAALDGSVGRQSAVIGFERVFALTGIAMVVLLPLIFVLRDKAHESPAAALPPAQMAPGE